MYLTQIFLILTKIFFLSSMLAYLVPLKGVVWDFGRRTSFPSEPVCYLSLEAVCNTFHSVLPVEEIAGARLAQVEGIC